MIVSNQNLDLEMLINERIYFLTCKSFWCILTLRTEEVSTWESVPFYQKWNKHYSKITNWAFQEQDYVRDKLLASNDLEFLNISEDLFDSILTKSLNSILEAANHAYKAYPVISEHLWLYYYYAQFLKEVLLEFEKIVKEDAKSYYERYKDNRILFFDLRKILEHERPVLDSETSSDKFLVENVFSNLDTFAIQLGEEWRKALLSAVRNR